MKMSQFRKLIREEIQTVLREAADPIEKVYGRLYAIGERYNSEDDLLNALDDYLESEGVFDIYEKWLEREETGAILSTAETAKLLKPMAEFLEGSKAPMGNQKRIYNAIYKLTKRIPYFKIDGIDWESDPIAYNKKSDQNSAKREEIMYALIFKQLSPESSKLLQKVLKSRRDGVFGIKKQIDTLVREIETINVNKFMQDYNKIAAKLPKN
jgi:hypothetical protein